MVFVSLWPLFSFHIFRHEMFSYLSPHARCLVRILSGIECFVICYLMANEVILVFCCFCRIRHFGLKSWPTRMKRKRFLRLWLKVQSPCYKSFVICTVYGPPSTPLNFTDDLANSVIESLLLGLDVIILGDLSCNLPRDNAESRALNDFCSTFNVSQVNNKSTRVTESGESLFDVVMITNEFKN